jgi:uncharacterized protein YcbK (DUF882 family)
MPIRMSEHVRTTVDAPSGVGPTRRRFITAAATGAAWLATPGWLRAAASTTRSLAFAHTHTGERLSVEYFSGGRYLTDALDAVNHFLRDFRTGDVHPIDRTLLDVLQALAASTGTSRSFEVISGYRSPATNQQLRRASEGVAAHSLHMEGRAIDVRLADVELAALRKAALNLRAGGVGYYPASNFVHVDTGRVRRW